MCPLFTDHAQLIAIMTQVPGLLPLNPIKPAHGALTLTKIVQLSFVDNAFQRERSLSALLTGLVFLPIIPVSALTRSVVVHGLVVVALLARVVFGVGVGLVLVDG